MSFKGFTVILASLLAIGSVHAQGKSAAEELTNLLQGYQTYQADFMQQVRSEQGQSIQEGRGELKAKRGGLFYWHIQPPMEQYIVADGEQVEVYDPDLEQVTIYPMDDKLTATPALLLSGNVEGLDESYRISQVSIEGNGHGFMLEPKDADSLFVSLTLLFDRKVLQEMRLKDSLGQSSLLQFSNVEINKEISDAAFTLEYPASVDIIRNRAAP